MSDLVTQDQSQLMQAYGSEDEIGGIFNRLMKMHPSARDSQIGDHGMRMVAQRAILAGADPLSEVHVWYSGGKVQTELDISYYRRKASELGLEILWVDQPRAISETERAEQGIPTNTIGGYCRGALRAEVKRNMDDFGMPFEKALQMCAREGVATAGEKAPPAGRTHTWVAQKRAEKDLYRKLGVTDNRLTTALTSHAHQVAEALTRAETKRIESRATVDEINDDLFPIESSAMAVVDEEVIEGELVEPAASPVIEALVEPEQELPLITDGQLKRLHALGNDLYGDDWKVKRAEIVHAVSQGAASSSSELTTKEAKKLIDGMKKRIAERDAESDQPEMSFTEHVEATEQGAFSEGE